MLEGYIYKIIFADGCWYWGTSQFKGLAPEKDGYYGSPVTHKHKWNEPHSKIVLKIFHNESERLAYEEVCIRPDLNNPRCLNENVNKAFSREVCVKAGASSASKSRGVPRTPEVREKISHRLQGRELSPDHVLKLKGANRPKRTPEAIAKGVENRRGYRHSEETRRKIKESQTGKNTSLETRGKISRSTQGFNWYNDGNRSVKARSHPGEGWVPGRIVRWDTPCNRGMNWYHRGKEIKMFAENPGDGWTLGRPVESGKRYYNNGTEHVLAFESPGDGWVLGRLRKK